MKPLISRMLLGVWLLAIMAAGMPPTAEAGTGVAIRVLLAAEANQVEVQTDGTVLVSGTDGRERHLPSPLIVTPGSAGLLLSGAASSSDRLTMHGGRTGLVIGLVQTTAGAGKPSLDGNAGVGTLTKWTLSGGLQVIQHGRQLMVVNEVDLEDYTKGVVPGEVSAGWHPEVLKAQAVAARTYALYQRTMSAGRDYDVVAGVQDQVYQGRQGVDERILRAVEETKGLVIGFQGRPIYAAFSSTAAGPTEDALNVWAIDLPYLRGVDCPFDLKSPYYRWRVAVPIDKLERALRQQGIGVGVVATVTPFGFSRAGRVTRIRILHSGGELLLRGEDLRKIVGYSILPSARFEIESVGSDVVFNGFGAGHGVGLCQWGAKEMAELGYSFGTILSYYYPGTSLLRIDQVDLSPQRPS
ncbi:MAG: SpoIID/LytB domain-containing protein [Nitrospiraceae bacterium]